MTFNDLGLIEPIKRAVREEAYEIPTPVQERTIPLLLAGRDVLGCAQTGTGKTAAFALPILQMLYNRRRERGTARSLQALILTPTRELAIQIGESFHSYGRYTGLKCVCIFGGVSQNPQTDALGAGVDILVATPGRLLDLIGQGLCDLSTISLFTLDEADRMLDMGFIHDVQKIISKIPTKRQTMLFSATMPQEIATLASSILKSPETVTVTPVSSTVDSIEQSVYFVDKANKILLLIELLCSSAITSALTFSRTKHGANKICKALCDAGIPSGVIHGNKSQSARQAALSDFKEGKTRVLVATDIAARGIDIDRLSHVINFDLPNEPETYVHRIGRTGRAGLSGIAISLCNIDEKAYLRSIERLINKEIPVVEQHPFPMQIFTLSPPEQKQPRNFNPAPLRSGAKSANNRSRHEASFRKNASHKRAARNNPDTDH
ncbi:MAG: DEAD/DEAH box helicase [Oscillospiraceae bacterium]|nr:DEAD/DEAH box helicase [Oscillospiraceae bacterium]